MTTTMFRRIDTGTPMAVPRSHFRRLTSVDECPDVSWLDGGERLNAFHEGAWHLMGIQAAATFLIPLDGHYVTQTITSPGLWGIESDSDDAYLDEIFSGECDSLAAMLAALGVAVAG